MFVVHAENTTSGNMNINLFVGLLVSTIVGFWSCEISNIYLNASEYANLYAHPIFFSNFGPSNIETLVK